MGGVDAPICQDKRLGCLRDVSAHAEVCHNTLVDFTGEEAFEAADDLASGPAASRPAGDVVDRRLVEPHADDDRAMEGGVRLSVPAPIETMPAGRHPGRRVLPSSSVGEESLSPNHPDTSSRF